MYIKNLISSYITRRDPHGSVVVALTLHGENPGSSSCGVTLQKNMGIDQSIGLHLIWLHEGIDGYGCWIRDAKMSRPAHMPLGMCLELSRARVPPALQALTCRLGAAARPCNVRACSHPGRCTRGLRAL